MWFAVEMNTGAVNGFYALKRDCVETTVWLSEKHNGSSWAFGKQDGKTHRIGEQSRLKSSAFHQDKEMCEKLHNYFGTNIDS